MAIAPGAGRAVALLLAINLFNYIDRQILAAVEPDLRRAFFAADDLSARGKTGLLATAFLLSYMVMAPVFGWLADRSSRWILAGISVALWSLASGWTGLAATFGVLVVTRMFVGVGEAGYGPSAPTIIADLYPVERRGRMLSLFYLAIPVGSALGYVLGGAIAARWGWRMAFYLVVPPGLMLASLCFFMRDPRRSALAEDSQPVKRAGFADYLALFKIKSYVLNTAAMAAMTFAIGGMAFWIPGYISDSRSADFPRYAATISAGHLPAATAEEVAAGVKAGSELLSEANLTFGIVTVAAGLLGTLLGGWAGDRVRRRFPSSYFLVSGIGILCAFPPTVAMLWVPFPLSWGLIFLAVFFLFFNTGPSNTALANVTPPGTRATAFALNIFAIHALGDASSPPLIGWIAGRWSMNAGFLTVSAMMVVASGFWFWGTRYLARDTELAGAAR